MNKYLATIIILTSVIIMHRTVIAIEREIPGFATETVGAATGTVPVSTDAAAPGIASGTPEIEPLIQPEGTIEGKASIVKVDGFTVYVDAGAVQGVNETTVMEVYMMEPIKDLEGEILDHVEKPVGTLKVTEVRSRLSICRPTAIEVPFERGFFVRFYVGEETKKDHFRSDRCPPGMLFDGGGPFTLTPGSVMDTAPNTETIMEETGEFCIDQYPADNITSWSTAHAECAAQGKRLCLRNELEKVCAAWERPKRCPNEVDRWKECMAENTVMDFRTDLEWAYEMAEKDDGMPYRDAFSCKCPGTAPICVHCYYEECRGAKKRYRCCHDSFPESE